MLDIAQKKLKPALIFPCLLVLASGCWDDKKNTQVSKVDAPQQKTESQQTIKPVESKQAVGINFDEKALVAFETCKITESFLKTREKIIKNFKPSYAFESYLTYKLTTKISNLPVKSIIFGVCSVDKPLQNDCSIVEEVAFILDVDYDKAKAQLKTDKGIDFSVVKRAITNGEEEGATLRPVLYRGNDGSTVLHCDTGGL